jgi:hypothetical protein
MLDLLEIIKIVPKHLLDVFQNIRIYCNKRYFYDDGEAHGCCLHWSSEWLMQHGNLPEKEKHVEIYNVDDYKQWVKTQPAMLFHEMVHGYHRRQDDDNFNDYVSMIY